jgi:hypothetical protein
MPSDKHIAKFQELYLNRFKKEIGVEEAREKLAALVRFLKIVLKPMDEEEFRELERRHNITQ